VYIFNVSAEHTTARHFARVISALDGWQCVYLDAYFNHPLRTVKLASTYLFANRMTKINNPTGAIEIFAAVRARYPGSRLVMNAAGELADQCRARIAELGIGASVE
jgi:hypothetical protein